MAFGAGVLISAVAFDLVVEAIGPAGADEISIDMLAGEVVFSSAIWPRPRRRVAMQPDRPRALRTTPA